MTSRELTDAIDRLIALRIHEAQYVMQLEGQQQRWDDIEQTKRHIADALKLLDRKPVLWEDAGKEP